ncbi:MAG TPA: phosphatase PAP2 family protein [Candidatus Nesterenkonia stercoripullorum]|uniref:Phosphatase PAP2 family protein n=1 Tax=Candidatus Nesterenkonia stercoripullorum TaxID=2838701 RepID=A0A9D1UV54_9MICC|nr:phosphatase PAP2 family protein [Candidatus Nesterenkonia stercoripullorum]
MFHPEPRTELCPEADSQPRTARRPALLAGAAVLIGGLLLALFGQETTANESVFGAAADTELFAVGYRASEVALLALVGMWGLCAVTLLVRRSGTQLVLLVAGGVGSVIAYVISRSVKPLFEVPRPCHVNEIMAQCPPPDSWTYPSNHTVIAFSLAVAVTAAVPRLGYAAAPIAVIVGLSRVFAGHHYPQDVLGGMALGVTVGLAVVLCAVAVWRVLAARRVGNQPSSA